MPSWTKPTAKQIEIVLARLKSPEHAAHFFARLENPLWVEPLRNAGVFAEPPPAASTPGGGWQAQHWPASRYLESVAAAAPNAVAAILAQVKTNNPFVVGDMIGAALAMPPQIAATIVPAICGSQLKGMFWIHFREVAQLCSHLAAAGFLEETTSLAIAAFAPSTKGEGDVDTRADWSAQVEGLKTVIPAICKSKPSRLLERMCNWLYQLVEKRKASDAGTGADYSYSWRPAIEQHPQNRGYDLTSVMVDLVRHGFEVAIRAGAMTLAESLVMVEKFNFLIFRRLRMHLIGEFAEQNPELAKSIMLSRESFDDYQFIHEYAMLMGKRFEMLSPTQQATWLGWIDAGPDAETRGQWDAESLADRVEYWKFEKLHWVRGHLQGERKQFYERMLDMHGEPTLSDMLVWHDQLRSGHESPYGLEDFAELSFEQVVKLVVEWKPPPNDIMGPSVEGLASEFRNYVAQDVAGNSANAAALVNRPAIFVRTFINEMSGAIKAGTAIATEEVLTLCEWVVSRPIDEVTTVKRSREALVDPDWQWSRSDVTEFVKAICDAMDGEKPRFALAQYRARLWGLVERLLGDSDKSDVLRDTGEDDPKNTDYLDLAINAPRGRAMEAALSYAWWVAQHVKKREGDRDVVPGGFESMPEFRTALEQQVLGDQRSVVSLAAFGARLNLIYWIDVEWLKAHVDRIFNLESIESTPMDKTGWVAWNSFLVWGRPHVEFYKLLRRQYEYAVEKSADVDLKEPGRTNPMAQLGEHLMALYGRGQAALDESPGSAGRFLQVASASLRRHALGVVGHALRTENQLPQEFVHRFCALWDWYWARHGPKDAEQGVAAEFGDWFSGDKVPPEWALKRLLTLVRINPTVESEFAVGERLAEIASKNIAEATEILDLMIRGDKDGWRAHSLKDATKQVLELSLQAGGETCTRALALIDHLGRRGFLEFGELLQKKR